MSVVELLGVIPESKLVIPEPGLRLNAFSLVNIVACVGMSVEFSAHILHQFISEPEVDGNNAANDRNRRVVHALTFMGPPIVHGVVTTLISTAFLATNDLGFIREYYFFMFFVLVLIASWNGLVVLPVLLSLIGDEPMPLKGLSVAESKGRKSIHVMSYNDGPSPDKERSTTNPAYEGENVEEGDAK
jgi:predicted RND superfamily exporter protein